jgi:hypothetical protein
MGKFNNTNLIKRAETLHATSPHLYKTIYNLLVLAHYLVVNQYTSAVFTYDDLLP